MKNVVKKNCKNGCSLKRFVFPGLGVLIIVLLMVVGNYLNSERAESEPSEFQTEEPLIPEEIKEQGEPELTKLNPDPQVKEGW